MPTNASVDTELIFLLEALKIKGDGGGGGRRTELTSFVGFHCLILECVRRHM